MEGVIKQTHSVSTPTRVLRLSGAVVARVKSECLALAGEKAAAHRRIEKKIPNRLETTKIYDAASAQQVVKRLRCVFELMGFPIKTD